MYCYSVFLFRLLFLNRLFYCRVFKTKAFDTLGLFQNKRDYWEAQLSGYLTPVRAFAAYFCAVKLDIVLYILQKAFCVETKKVYSQHYSLST